MNSRTRKMVMNHYNRTRDGGDRTDGTGSRRYGNDIENRFRDDRGREHYDNGRYAPMNRYDGSRMRDDTIYPYMGGNDEHGANEMHYPYRRVWPMYEDRSGETRRNNTRPMNKIGFSVDGEMERMPHEVRHDYKTETGYEPMNEMSRRAGSARNGYAEGDGYIPFTRQMATEWTSEMKNSDGTHGAHWTLDQAKQVMAQRNIECDPLEFWAALNMVYSDFYKVAKKHGLATNMEFYVDMAKSFLDDEDAGPDKIARYYEYVVK